MKLRKEKMKAALTSLFVFILVHVPTIIGPVTHQGIVQTRSGIQGTKDLVTHKHREKQATSSVNSPPPTNSISAVKRSSELIIELLVTTNQNAVFCNYFVTEITPPPRCRDKKQGSNNIIST